MARKNQSNPPVAASDQEAFEERFRLLRENPERLLVRSVSVIARCGPAYVGKMLARLGLSHGQTIVLVELYRHDGCSQEELRSIVKLDKGNITRALQRLEEHGFVHRRQDPRDRRVVRVYLTAAAFAIERELLTIALHWEDKLTQGLTPKERETAVRLLSRIQANAEALARTDAPETVDDEE